MFFGVDGKVDTISSGENGGLGGGGDGGLDGRSAVVRIVNNKMGRWSIDLRCLRYLESSK